MWNVVVFTAVISVCLASVGDNSPYFRKCVYKCLDDHCISDGKGYKTTSVVNIFYALSYWQCDSECQYECMWATVDLFEEKNYRVPQFFGKWPFVKFLTMQEPASAIFSLLNLYAHIKMFGRMRRDVRSGSPYLWMWYLHAFVCSHAWIWSAVFHARDTELTEFMDYSCAYSMVLFAFYTMLMRFLNGVSKIILLILSLLCLSFFISHTAYLFIGRFDYSYNMKVNIVTGALAVIGWLIFAALNMRKLGHAWKIAVYVTLIAVTTLLELIDAPPIFWVFDYHSLWHLATFPIAFIGYSFAIDDCKYLNREKEANKKYTLG